MNRKKILSIVGGVVLLGAVVALFAQKQTPPQQRASRDVGATSEEYDKSGRTWDHWDKSIDKRRANSFRTRILFEVLKVTKGLDILDVGCGVGFFSFILADMVGEDGTIYATDINPKMIKILQANIDKLEVPNIDPVLVDFYEAGVPADSVDIVFSNNVYNYTDCGLRELAEGKGGCREESNGEAFKRYHRVLRDGGHLLIANDFVFSKNFKSVPGDGVGASGIRRHNDLDADKLIDVSAPWFTVEQRRDFSEEMDPMWRVTNPGLAPGYLLVFKKK